MICLPRLSRTATIALVAGCTLIASAAPAMADLPASAYVFDGPVSKVLHSGTDTYVAGSFTSQLSTTGGGVPTPTTGAGELSATFPKVAGPVEAVVADGAGGWFIGGDFDSVAGVPRRNLAHITSTGTLDPAWDPAANGRVTALELTGNRLYVAGRFDEVDGTSRAGLAAIAAASGELQAWSATLLEASDDGSLPADIYEIALHGSTLLVAGSFNRVGATPRRGLAGLDPTTAAATPWDPQINTGVSSPGRVFSIAVEGTTVYVGGDFQNIDGAARNSLGAVTATTGAVTSWNPSPLRYGNTEVEITDIVASGASVFVAGGFTTIGGQTRWSLAELSASSGSATSFDPQINEYAGVFALVLAGDTLYVGGNFHTIGGQRRRGVAALDTANAAARSFAPRTNGQVNALALAGAVLYIGGEFSGAGLPVANINGVARVRANGDLDTSFAPNPIANFGLGDQPGNVTAMAKVGSTLYVGGAFTKIGGEFRHELAALNTSTGVPTGWNPSPNYLVNHLAATPTTVYVAGNFTTIGGQPRSHLAAVSAATGQATAWDPNIGNYGVDALHVTDTALYVGGNYPSIAGQARTGGAAFSLTTGALTSWNPSADGPIFAFDDANSRVYTGGWFTTIGGRERPGVASLDPSTGAASPWLNTYASTVGAVAATNDDVYVAGGVAELTGSDFTDREVQVAAISVVTGIASTFRPRFQGGTVTALDAEGKTVLAGGSFNFVDGKITGPFARLTDTGTPGTAPDLTPPDITITSPTEGQRVSQGATVPAVFSCADPGGSGVETCAGPATLDTATPGPKTFTVAATDKEGNSASKTVNYIVDEGTIQPPPTSDQTGAARPLTNQPLITPPGRGPVEAASDGQIRAALARVVSPSGARAKIVALLKNGFTFTFTAPAAGKLQIAWYFLPKGAKLAAKPKPVLFASGTATSESAGATKITVRFNATGKKRLKTSKSIKLTGKATFASTGSKPLTTTKTFTLKR